MKAVKLLHCQFAGKCLSEIRDKARKTGEDSEKSVIRKLISSEEEKVLKTLYFHFDNAVKKKLRCIKRREMGGGRVKGRSNREKEKGGAKKE